MNAVEQRLENGWLPSLTKKRHWVRGAEYVYEGPEEAQVRNEVVNDETEFQSMTKQEWDLIRATGYNPDTGRYEYDR